MMKERLQNIKDEALKAIEAADMPEKLNDVRVKFLGKKGELTAVLKGMKDVAPEDRPKVGQMVNETRAAIEAVLEENKEKMEKAIRAEKLKKEVIDVTLPAKKNCVGHRHPNTIALEEVERVFTGMGYEVVEGPEIEYDEYNFRKLNIPDGHPAKDEQELENLCILPIPVTADGKGYYERESFTPEEFYDLIDSCENIPSTSHIPAIAFQEKYEQAWEKGYTHLVVVTIYSGASAMYQSALMAKNAFLEEHPDAMRIEVIDSNCYAMGYGYPIIQACHKALERESFENVVSYIKDYLSRVKIYFSPFTLKSVKKAGRVSGTAAFVGELIGLRPVISAVGTTNIVEKVRGNAAILTTMVKFFKEQRSKAEEKAPYMILVARDTEMSEELAKACENVAGYPPVGVFKIGAAITTGPQIIGMTFLGD